MGRSGGRGPAARAGPPSDDALIKQRNKLERQLAEISALDKKRASGAPLEPNQVAKIQRRDELQESLRSVYMQGTTEQRSRLGVCENCGRSGHNQGNCPRPKAVAPAQASGRVAAAAPATRDCGGSSERGSSAAASRRGRGSGRAVGKERGRGGVAAVPRQHRNEHTGDMHNRSQRVMTAPSEGGTSDSGSRSRVSRGAQVQSLVEMTGAQRGVAAAALLACNGDANAAAVALLTGDTSAPAHALAPAPSRAPRVGGGTAGRADDLLASMFAYKPPPPEAHGDEDDSDDRDHTPGGAKKRDPVKGKVPLDRHGLPLARRGQGKGGGGGRDRGSKDRREPRPETPTVDDYILIKFRNRIEKQLADIARLENKRAVGAALEPNQLEKIAKRAEVEESLRQVHLPGTYSTPPNKCVVTDASSTRGNLKRPPDILYTLCIVWSRHERAT
jgi:hypothetical protein